MSGNLKIEGVNPEDILFTSLYDDEYGGDTTNDGVSTPAPGQAGGLVISETGSLDAKGFTMRYSGGSSHNYDAGISIDRALAEISNAVFSHNYPHAIRAVNSENITIENARFENHDLMGTWGEKAALAVYTCTTTLTNITFENNLLGVVGNAFSTFFTDIITWLNNTATTSPSGLF